jgi:hypothetical protein
MQVHKKAVLGHSLDSSPQLIAKSPGIHIGV